MKNTGADGSSSWAVRMQTFESVLDKKPRDEHDIEYWTKAILETKMARGVISVWTYDELMSQLSLSRRSAGLP